MPLLLALFLLTAAEPPAARWTALAPKKGERAEVTLKAAIAEAPGLVPIVLISTSWCGPCRAIEKYRNDPLMLAAFAGTNVLDLDGDVWSEAELKTLGYRTGIYPVFIAVGPDARSTGRTISGDAWGDNIPANMAPPLSRFVRSLSHR